MEALVLRAASAEARLDALEATAANEGARGGGGEVARDLADLRGLIAKAVEEADALRAERDAAKKQAEKLQYQVTFLKRAYYEAAGRGSEAPPVTGANSVGA